MVLRAYVDQSYKPGVVVKTVVRPQLTVVIVSSAEQEVT